MNCLKFQNKLFFMDSVQTMSNEDLNLQRRLTLNLLDKIDSKYNSIKKDIELTVIPALKTVIKTNNTSLNNENFKNLLKEVFNAFSNAKDFLQNLKNYSNYVREDSDYSREESIQIISETYDKITSEDETGCYDKCLSLVNLIINQTAIVMYRLYNIALLDEESLKPFLSAPKVLLGGLDEKGEPDLKYTIKRLVYQFAFDVKFVEGEF